MIEALYPQTALSFAAASPRGRRVVVSCAIEIENTGESLHAHVHLDGAEPGPGDRVIVHGAPPRIDFGDKRIVQGRATVVRAGLIGRWRARIAGQLGLRELYEVSFSDGRLA